MALTTITNSVPTLVVGTPEIHSSGGRGVYVAQIIYPALTAPDTLDVGWGFDNGGTLLPTLLETLDTTAGTVVWTTPPFPSESGFRLDVTQPTGTGIAVGIVVWALT